MLCEHSVRAKHQQSINALKVQRKYLNISFDHGKLINRLEIISVDGLDHCPSVPDRITF